MPTAIVRKTKVKKPIKKATPRKPSRSTVRLNMPAAPPPVVTANDLRLMLKNATAFRPNWTELKRDMDKALHAFYGGEMLYVHIAPFSRKEDPEKLDWRRSRTVDHYENYVEEILGAYIEGIYRTGDIKRETGETSSMAAQLDEYFAKDYDVWFQNDAAPFALLLREVFIFLEYPEMPEGTISMAQQEQLKAWPRPKTVMPDGIRNLKMGKDGKLDWIARDVELASNGQKCIEILDRTDRWIVGLDANTSVLYRAPHGFREVPVVWKPYRMDRGLGGAIGISFMAQTIRKSLACLQIVSMLVEAGYFHLNLQMVMDPDTFDEALAKGMGNAEVLIYKGGKDGKEPFFMQKPSMELETLHRWAFDDFPKSIYRSARVRDRSSDKAMNQSGVSKLMDVVPELAVLKLIANYLQAIDQEVVRLISTSYLGKDVTPKCEYPTRFDLKTPSEMMKELTELAMAEKDGVRVTSPTMIGQLQRQIAAALLPDADEETLEAMENEIAMIVEILLANLEAEYDKATSAEEEEIPPDPLTDTPLLLAAQGDGSQAPPTPASQEPQPEGKDNAGTVSASPKEL